MRDQIVDALRGWPVEYLDLRLEESQTTRIAYRGRALDEIGQSRAVGGCVRALYRGGWGFVSFNRLDALRDRVAQAVEHARAVGGERSALADAPVVVDDVPATVVNDPMGVSLSDTKALLDDYNDIIWRTPLIQSSTIRYFATKRVVTFANSAGSSIVQRMVDCSAGIGAVARDGANVQESFLSLGANGDYGFIEGLHERVRECAATAVRLLRAKSSPSGPQTVLLDPTLAGVFIHEAFGHLSEADALAENASLRAMMTLGRRFGSPLLNVVDGAAIPGLRGSYRYDDEGVAATTTTLLRDGVLAGRLHSLETAGALGEAPTGNARALNYRFPPIVRMTNTHIVPGTTSLPDMLAEIKDGVYAKGWWGGTTTMEQFTFTAAEAFRVRHGRIEEPLRGVTLSGNLFSTLQNIIAIGNDLTMSQGGGCGKGDQSPLPVADGGPHVLIRNCLVGGQ